MAADPPSVTWHYVLLFESSSHAIKSLIDKSCLNLHMVKRLLRNFANLLIKKANCSQFRGRSTTKVCVESQSR